jgi:hypothetical protein
LIADSTLTAPQGIIEADCDFGRFRFEALAFASSANPKTSRGHGLQHAIGD